MATAKQVALTFLLLDEANDGDGISNLKLQKLVYYAQGFFTAIHGRPLFDERIEAWTHGPVVPELYQLYRDNGKNPIPVPNGLILSDFRQTLEDSEIELIEEVYEVFGQYAAWQLRNMTHEEAPWMAHEAQSDIIPVQEMQEYFTTRLV
jgi:uncharacterized phage-associated protein